RRDRELQPRGRTQPRATPALALAACESCDLAHGDEPADRGRGSIARGAAIRHAAAAGALSTRAGAGKAGQIRGGDPVAPAGGGARPDLPRTSLHLKPHLSTARRRRGSEKSRRAIPAIEKGENTVSVKAEPKHSWPN